MSHGPHWRASASLAFMGALLLTAGTWLRPTGTGPNDLAAAFGTYARADRVTWVLAHLAQLAGVAAMGLAVILLAGVLAAQNGALRRAVTVLATTTIAVAAMMQAVDGVALKATVDRWQSAAGGRRLAAFEAATAVRNVEIGLGALLALFAAATVIVFGIAVLKASPAHISVPSRTGWGAATIGVGAATAAAGTAIAVAGYSSMAILLATIAVLAVVVWAVLLGAWTLNVEALNVEALNVEALNVEALNVEALNVAAQHVQARNAAAQNVAALHVQAQSVHTRNVHARNADTGPAAVASRRVADVGTG